MARKRKRNPLSERLSRIRYRAKSELEQLTIEEARLKSPIRGRKTKRQEEITRRKNEIESLIASTYLGRRATADKTASASAAGEQLRKAISKAGERKRKAAQRRANEIAWEQIGVERRGGESEIWGGALNQMRGEQIFWASTRDIWTGADPKDRLKVVMDALGTDSLEEAIDLVLSASSEAVLAQLDYDATKSKEEDEPRGSAIWIAFVSSFYLGSDGSLHIARR